MQGRHVVWVLGVGVVVLAVLIWGVGAWMVDAIDTQAESEGVPRLTQEQAAERVAREDRFGLPSRLENPPARDIETHRKVGTEADPLPPTPDGALRLMEAYAVTLELCAKRAKTGHSGPVELQLDVVARHVKSVLVPGREGEAWQTFESCMAGGLQRAVFDAPINTRIPVAVEL